MSGPEVVSLPRPAIDGLWRRDVGEVPAVRRRAAHYALRMVAHCPLLHVALEDDDFLSPLWNTVFPLVDPEAFDTLCDIWQRQDAQRGGNGSRAGRRTLRFDDERTVYRHVDAARIAGDSMRRELQRRFRAIPEELLQRLADVEEQTPGNAAVAVLAQMAGLDRVEASILDFADMVADVPSFRVLSRHTGATRAADHHTCIAAAIAAPVSEVRRAMRRSGALNMLRLVQVTRSSNDLEDYLHRGSVLEEVRITEPTTASELVDCFAERPSSTQCQLSDFPHLDKEARRLRTVLGNAARQGERGVNALLYGAPGTGKTQFAQAMAASLGLTPVLVKTSNGSDGGLKRKGRLGAYQLIQRLLAEKRDCLIVFDEVEDVFTDASNGFLRLFGGTPPAGREKGWMNRVLEENPVPAIWITNDADGMDRAFLRRFLLPISFVAPPREVRRQIAQRHLGADIEIDALIDDLARDDKLMPAQFDAARRLLTLQPDDDPVTVVREGVSASRRLLCGSASPMARKSATRFDIAYVNLAGGIAPDRIGAALARTGRGSLCFYGPPGTGKTEFAHRLAEGLGRELVVRRASSLISCWHGGTEQNIAQMFAGLDVERQVLFLDEVDSFLRDRRQAQRGWEVREVNELLQQMECFPGVFIAATNLMDQVDPAALRRFDFKLNFRPLNLKQRLSLFAREAMGDEQRASELPTALAGALAELEALTPGDFANVARQRDLLGEALTPEAFLRRLAIECRWKSD